MGRPTVKPLLTSPTLVRTYENQPMTTLTDEQIENVLTLFAAAEQADEKGDDSKACDLSQDAFNLAEDVGWKWEDDTDFTHWALKATSLEILREGRNRFIEWCNRFYSMQRLNEQLTARGFDPLSKEQEAVYLSFSHDVGEERANMVDDIKARILGATEAVK